MEVSEMGELEFLVLFSIFVIGLVVLWIIDTIMP